MSDRPKPKTSEHPAVLDVRQSTRKLHESLRKLDSSAEMLAVRVAAGKVEGISIASEALGVASSRVFLIRRNEASQGIVTPYDTHHGGNPIDKASFRRLKQYATRLVLFIQSIECVESDVDNQ